MAKSCIYWNKFSWVHLVWWERAVIEVGYIGHSVSCVSKWPSMLPCPILFVRIPKIYLLKMCRNENKILYLDHIFKCTSRKCWRKIWTNLILKKCNFSAQYRIDTIDIICVQSKYFSLQTSCGKVIKSSSVVRKVDKPNENS